MPHNQQQDMSEPIRIASALSVIGLKRVGAVEAYSRRGYETSRNEIALVTKFADIQNNTELFDCFRSIQFVEYTENTSKTNYIQNLLCSIRFDNVIYLNRFVKHVNSSWSIIRKILKLDSKKRDLCDIHVFELLENLLMLQIKFKYKRLGEIYAILSRDSLAAGYVYGFHEACFHIHRCRKLEYVTIKRWYIRESYLRIFGEQAGFKLYLSTFRRKRDREFKIGWQSGYDNFTDYHAEGAPTFGLQRIISLGFDASMVERTLNKRSG